MAVCKYGSLSMAHDHLSHLTDGKTEPHKAGNAAFLPEGNVRTAKRFKRNGLYKDKKCELR